MRATPQSADEEIWAADQAYRPRAVESIGNIAAYTNPDRLTDYMSMKSWGNLALPAAQPSA